MSTIREIFFTYSDARQTNEKTESDLSHLIFNPQDIVPIRFKLVEKFKSGCVSDSEDVDDPLSYPTDIFFEEIGSIVAREEVSIDSLSSLKQKSERNLHKEHFGSILSKSLGVPEDLHPPIFEKLFEVVDDEDAVPLLPIEVVITNVNLALTSRWLENLAQSSN